MLIGACIYGEESGGGGGGREQEQKEREMSPKGTERKR